MTFKFGENWLSYAERVGPMELQAAADSLRSVFPGYDFHGKRVLDIGCGSGLFSVAAAILGATVTSFDADLQSVLCTTELANRLCARVDASIGSVLDPLFLSRLGQFDFVYVWGVLHHTGDLYQAIGNACTCVLPGGYLCISIYNDQGIISSGWRMVKWLYNHVPWFGQWPLQVGMFLFFMARHRAKLLLHGKNPFVRRRVERGMSEWHDAVDWVGGWPWEVAKPEDVVRYVVHKKDFELVNQKLVGNRMGCNEFVFRKSAIAKK